MKRIAVFGSTGSIGKQTLSVCEMHGEEFCVEAIVFGSNTELGAHQIQAFDPGIVGVFDKEAAKAVREAFPEKEVVSGNAVWDIASRESIDIVVNGVSGFSGTFPLISALRAGKTVALANKESVVCAGGLVRAAQREGGGRILPVDSEQSAIFQCLSAGKKEDVKRLILTASGGAFRDHPIEKLADVTPEMAMKHPNWSMGKKITIDSATMFNKGLEIMEAAFLFDQPGENISVLIHPQSIVHSMVEFADNSVVAQLGVPDMRLAIQYALTYPDRQPSPAAPLDLAKLAGLTFTEPDAERFPALTMAYEALRTGGSMPVAYNSGNEAAVARFVNGELRFTDVADCVRYVMDGIGAFRIDDIDALLYADQTARRLAREYRVKRFI
ncbi:MAG: 1-deoxy-D-xylulose-5-phosphate reductoisomerase [Clostridia bacterium]|nr:1-deoxy-D-xylulose-5-phosphate reductoisomerase [Clostridia bacterium]